jgi:O-antigen ligase
MSDVLNVAGCLAAVAAVGAALLTANARIRAAGLIAGMAIATALIAGQGWDELEPVRSRPAELAALLVGGFVVLAAGAAAIRRWPALLPLLLVAALPFRVRIHVGGGEAVNLLVPLYVVIGAGVLAAAVGAIRDGVPRRPVPQPLLIVLIGAMALYALQASYSDDISFAARNVGFFLVPFAVMFSLLVETAWTPRLLAMTLGVVLGEALVFAVIGIVQHLSGEIFWNGKLEQSNEFHFYFRVNSAFWDPNIFGRYLALAILLSAAALSWVADPRRAAGLAAALAVLAAGLLFSFSQTSFVALFLGLAVLAALRWSVRWAAAGTALAAIGVAAALLVMGGGSNGQSTVNTEGRDTLISGGLELAKQRPLAGYGSASFSKRFAAQEDVKEGENTLAHNEPVTVAAEQGFVGIAVYAASVVIALWVLFSGMRRIAPGLGAPFPPREGRTWVAARIGIAAAFCALMVHTIGYAGYLTDPLTWTLLAVGGALGFASAPKPPPQGR